MEDDKITAVAHGELKLGPTTVGDEGVELSFKVPQALLDADPVITGITLKDAQFNSEIPMLVIVPGSETGIGEQHHTAFYKGGSALHTLASKPAESQLVFNQDDVLPIDVAASNLSKMLNENENAIKEITGTEGPTPGIGGTMLRPVQVGSLFDNFIKMHSKQRNGGNFGSIQRKQDTLYISNTKFQKKIEELKANEKPLVKLQNFKLYARPASYESFQKFFNSPAGRQLSDPDLKGNSLPIEVTYELQLKYP